MTIVDTDILIDSAMQINDAVICLDRIEEQSVLSASVITKMEMFAGCRNKIEYSNAERFLRRFNIIKLNENMCDVAIDLMRQYRLSHGLSISDALIAATALSMNLPFITKNQRHYRYIDNLQLLPYPINS